MKVEINPRYETQERFVCLLPTEFVRNGEVIYKGRNELRLYLYAGLNYVVKRYRKPHFINRFVYGTLRRSKAYRSYHYGLRLLAMGVSTPEPVAYLEEYSFGLRYSYLVTLQADVCREIREFTDVTDVTPHLDVLRAFGRFTADLHNKGILHQDYSPGNILFDTTDGTPRFTLVDINRMKFKKEIGEEEGYHNLRRLWLTDEVYRVIARAYAEARGFNPDIAEERILALKNHFMANRYK